MGARKTGINVRREDKEKTLEAAGWRKRVSWQCARVCARRIVLI